MGCTPRIPGVLHRSIECPKCGACAYTLEKSCPVCGCLFADVEKRRHPWFAVVFNLLASPLGQVYAGRFRRAVFLWAAGTMLLPTITFSLISLPLGQWAFWIMAIGVGAFPVFVICDAYWVARRNRAMILKRYQTWWFYFLLFFVFSAGEIVISESVRLFVAESFVVPGRAMSPTIQHRDRILVDKLWTDTRRLRYYDVVVFRSKGPGSPMYAMRVIGLPGDLVEIRDEVLLMNGAKADDPAAIYEGPFPPSVDVANFGPLTIPDGSFFVLGDNRRMSNDSRLLGPIPSSDLYGTAEIIYWSRDHTFSDSPFGYESVPAAIRWDRIGQRVK